MSKRLSHTVAIKVLCAPATLAVCLLLVAPTKSHATSICMQEGLNLAYQSLPSDVASCLALEVDDLSLAPVSTKVGSVSVAGSPWVYANLVHECTVALGHDTAALFDNYITEAFIETNKYCKESVDFEIKKEAFEEFVFGEEFLSWDSGSYPRDEKLTASMVAPLSLGRGLATQEQIHNCVFSAWEHLNGVVAATLDRCQKHSRSENANGADPKQCSAIAGGILSELNLLATDATSEFAGNNCIRDHNYRLSKADINNVSADSESVKREIQKFREAIEALKKMSQEAN